MVCGFLICFSVQCLYVFLCGFAVFVPPYAPSVFVNSTVRNPCTLIFSREIRCIVYVPFSGESIRGVAVEEITAHMALKSCINSGNLSAAVGRFIALGKTFLERGVEEIMEVFISAVAPLLQEAMSDVVPSYTIVLWFAREVR